MEAIRQSGGDGGMIVVYSNVQHYDSMQRIDGHNASQGGSGYGRVGR